MLKKDPVFWWATGISVLALGLFAVTQSQFWLALMIGSYLLRPTLASLGVAKRYVDERQLSIHYRSGNIGFAVTIVMCVIFAVKLGAESNHDFELFVTAIVIGLVAKALVNVILARDLRDAASKILIGAGLLIAIFASADSFDSGKLAEIFVNAVPGLAIAGVGLFSKAHPRPAGIVVLASTAILLWVMFSRGFTWGQIVAAVIVGMPLILAALCLLSGDKIESDAEPTNAA